VNKKELTLEEAENIVDKMYQNRFIECGVDDGNTIHMGNLDKLQFNDLERASILLLRTEIRQKRELNQYKNNWEELKGYIKKFPGISYVSSEKVDGERLSGKLIPATKILNKMKELEEKNND
jgi:hypothetical protein